MPTMIDVRPDMRLACKDDWLGPPWASGEAALLIHGVAETSRAWTAWVPHLGVHCRVLRPDLPGFGSSSAAPAGYDWSTPALAAEQILKAASD